MPTEFDAFLFARIGQEPGGMPLSVLSVLARHGLDPWEEADRLSKLSKSVATQRLATLVTALSRQGSATSDEPDLAGRLVELLPRGGTAARPERKTVAVLRQRPPAWLVLLLVAIVALMIWY